MNRKIILSLLFLPFVVPFAGAADQKKPNVVVMMVDNLGWGELGCYGGGELRGAATPRLDKLAQEVAEFQCRASVHPHPIGIHDGAPADPLGHNESRLEHALWAYQLGDHHGRAILRCRL